MQKRSLASSNLTDDKREYLVCYFAFGALESSFHDLSVDLEVDVAHLIQLEKDSLFVARGKLIQFCTLLIDRHDSLAGLLSISRV